MGLHAKVSADLLKGHFHWPAHQKPFHDLMRRPLQIGAEDGARFKLAFGVAYQHPTDGQGRQAAAVPDGSAGGDFDLTVRLAIPVGKRQPPPDSAGIGEDLLE